MATRMGRLRLRWTTPMVEAPHLRRGAFWGPKGKPEHCGRMHDRSSEAAYEVLSTHKVCGPYGSSFPRSLETWGPWQTL
ncbi:hypothetical protein NDU88_005450 [Pleurodeles waltl]|uniref:Uncharacterized protein n=1 Tax=Pleurodeles waltl TaxID=8319 RepID=A0AAV7UI30_PLEWA|nr:hypothetical protein NDU88_005450 [Pleurodeles waltl]